jgi:hypothetical protein
MYVVAYTEFVHCIENVLGWYYTSVRNQTQPAKPRVKVAVERLALTKFNSSRKIGPRNLLGSNQNLLLDSEIGERKVDGWVGSKPLLAACHKCRYDLTATAV